MEDVVVIGAGWAGLAAARRLRREGVDPLVVERGASVGGAAKTHTEGGWLLEAGPHAFFPGHPAIQRFLDDAGGARDLEPAPARADRFITRRGKRITLPKAPPGIITSRVLSPAAKLRLLAEPLIPPRDVPDESVAAFTCRRFGTGVAPLVDAMVTGIFAGDPDRLSVRNALPRLHQAEMEHGSVFRGLGRAGRGRGTLSAPREGMGPWLAERADRLRISCNREVLRVEGEGPFRIMLQDAILEARRVLLAVPPEAAAALLDVEMGPLPRAPIAVVGLGWRNGSSVQERFSGYGVLHPSKEQRFTLGVLYESSLFPGRAPPGGVLVRALVGGRRHPERVALPDEDLVAQTVADVLDLHDLEIPPDWTKVLRPPSIPQPEQGHAERLAPLIQRVSAADGRASAGWGWRGVGIADAVQDGHCAAERLLGGRHSASS